MTDFTAAVKKKLKEHGCSFDREGKGDHAIWYSPITQTKFPVDGCIRSRHTANEIMKQAGIPHHF